MSMYDPGPTEWDELRASTRFFTKTHTDQQSHLGPSAIGQPCLRHDALMLTGHPHAVEPDTGAADVGTALHNAYEEMVPEEQAAVVLTVPGLNRPGEADRVNWAERIVTDLKTHSGPAFQSVLNYGPADAAWRQANLYAYAAASSPLGKAQGDGWRVRILAVNRDTGESAQWTRPADLDAATEDAAALADREATVVDVPDPWLVGATPTGSCRWCPWRPACPEGDGLYPPTVPADTLTDEDRAAALAAAEEYLALGKVERDAKAARELVKARLIGVAGNLGGVTVKWTDVAEAEVPAYTRRGYTKADVRRVKA